MKINNKNLFETGSEDKEKQKHLQHLESQLQRLAAPLTTSLGLPSTTSLIFFNFDNTSDCKEGNLELHEGRESEQRPVGALLFDGYSVILILFLFSNKK